MLEDIVIDTPVDRPHTSGQTSGQTFGRAPSQPLRVAVLWKTPNLGLYSNAAFDDLYNGIGHNNGNLAFVHSICSHIANPVKHFSWGSSAETLRNNADIIVIPCANQLGRHTDYGQMAENLEKSGLPIVAIGLGAQANSYDHDIELSPGTLRWAQVIAASNPASATSPNIYTRGAYTTAQLDKLGITGSLPGGCPSHFLNQAPGLRGGHETPTVLRAAEALRVAGMKPTPVGLRARTTFQSAMALGLAVEEYRPGSPGAQEIERLWAFVADQLEPRRPVNQDHAPPLALRSPPLQQRQSLQA